MGDNRKKRKISTTELVAFIGLFFGALVYTLLFIETKIDNVDFSGFVQLFRRIAEIMMFIIVAIVGFGATQDGLPIYKSFFKISYILAVVVFSVFLLIPTAKEILALF